MQPNLHIPTETNRYESSTLEVSTSAEVDSAWIKTKSDLRTHVISGAKLFFGSLSPLEKGFFLGAEGGHINRQVMQELYTCLKNEDERKTTEWIHEHLRSANPGKITKNDLLKLLPSHLSSSSVNFMQNGRYDYFEELKKQYKGYRAGQSTIGYNLMQSSDEIRSKGDGNAPDVVFMVEGIHSLGIGNPEDEFLHEGETPNDITVGRLKSRIRQLKGEEVLEDNELKKWEHPPLLFRLSNHFGNGLFGHARSFPESAKALLDQRRNLDKGALKASSFDIVCELLGLDEQLQPTGSKRILIDMMHLSAQARNDLYQNVFRRFNKNIDPSNPIPVVFSNAAYSGVDYLAEMVKFNREGNEGRENGKYFTGSINLSDEDVLAVFWSSGLIALALDERKMGGEVRMWDRFFSNSVRNRAKRLLANQIAGIISVPFAYHLTNPLQMWDNLTVGSGLSGQGELFDLYRNSKSCLEEDLEEILAKLKKEEPMWFGGYKPSSLVTKLCDDNISAFVSKNL